MEKSVRSLTIIRASKCEDRLELLREQIEASVNDGVITIFHTEGMPADQVYQVTKNLQGAAELLHTRHYVDDVHGLAFANFDKRTHIVVGKPVSYEPTASTVNFGGLTIPFVADRKLSLAFTLVERVTVCVVK